MEIAVAKSSGGCEKTEGVFINFQPAVYNFTAQYTLEIATAPTKPAYIQQWNVGIINATVLVVKKTTSGW